MIFTTKNRVEYIAVGNCAYPAKHPNPPRHGGFNADLDWNEDTARAVITVIESGVTNEIFNISGNYEEKNIEVVKKIIKFLALLGITKSSKRSNVVAISMNF